mmetsp:Transcript_52004/g.105972  ORF Transcript_52004/g.105972 Transcript_52004/m.105972 type:complete len:164 (+) Transcript_52004:17-508(+)
MVDTLTEAQLKELHTSFTLLDGDGDGRIDAVDLQKFLGTFNASFSLQELEGFINDETCTPHGVIDFPEFVAMLSRLVSDALHMPAEVNEESLRIVMEAWDADEDGLISANDLREVVMECGEQWNDEDINEMIYHRKDDGLFEMHDLRELIGRGSSKHTAASAR